MPTFSGTVKNRQIIFVTVASISGDQNPQQRAYDSLLDTGAQGTCISQKVAQELGLVSIGTTEIIPVNGQSILTAKYRIRLDIPITSGIVLRDGKEIPETTLRGRDVDVAQLPYQPKTYDILLGLDFLLPFHVTMFGGTFILSS
jgi:predicted aspartyl protease